MDRTARNAMIVEHLPLVGYIVAETCARATHLSRDDLAQVGSVALVQAADAFDPTLGVPFGAYARTRITGAIADDLRAGDWASRGTRKRIRETLATQEALSAGLGRSVTPQEIADAMGVDRQTAVDALTDAARTITPIDETVHDTVAADLPLPGEDLLEAEKRRYLLAAVQALPDRMRLIVEAVYFGDRTVTDVAAEARDHPLGRVAAALRGDAPAPGRPGRALRRRRHRSRARLAHHGCAPERLPRPRRHERRRRRRPRGAGRRPARQGRGELTVRRSDGRNRPTDRLTPPAERPRGAHVSPRTG